MRLDRILQVLLPRDEHFYGLFEESTQNIVHAASALMNLPLASTEERARIIAEIEEYEHQGDLITHRIFLQLSGTFVTPFDPEDIHVLASALDDILDNIDGAAGRFLLYKVREVPPEMVKLIRSLHGSVLELQRGVHMLRRLHKSNDLRAVVERVNEYENEADSIFESAIANLFDSHTDPIEIIKLKEIYVSLETATDDCEDAANVLETIMIKHA
jgi:predicted phosphate transport protein (TIGR00153 family)